MTILLFFILGCSVLYITIYTAGNIFTHTCKMIADLILGIVHFFKYTLPNRERLNKEKLEKEKEEALRLAAIEKKRLESEQEEKNKVVMAALNRASFLQNYYPYCDYNLIDSYITTFNSNSLLQIKRLEEEIKNSHIKNKSLRDTSNDVFTAEDLVDYTPIETRVEHPFKLSMYAIGNQYIIHIKNSSNNTEDLIQSSDKYYIESFMKDARDKFDALKIYNRQKNHLA